MTSLDDIRDAEVEDERSATLRVLEILDQLVAEIADCPQIWRWGDGRGGFVFRELERRIAVAIDVAHPEPSKPGRKSLGQGIRYRVMERDGFACRSCGVQLDLSIDHIIPLAKGGTDEIENLQTLCLTCNVRKGVS